MKRLLVLLTMALALASCASTNKMASQTAPLMNGQSPDLDTVVTTVEGKDVKIQKFIEKKPTVLLFYRGGWCPHCNKQLSRIRKITKDINKLGYQIIAVSPDRVSKIAESAKKYAKNYTVISDSSLNLASEFRLSFKVDKATLVKYKTFGINLEEASGKKHHSLPIPAVYVMDTKGLIHFNYVNPNYRVRVNEKILLNALKELKLK